MQDIRFALRVLLKNRAFTFIAALSLALGIGANSAIFSLADAVLLRPLPVLEPSSIVNVATITPDNPFGSVSYPNYRDLQTKAHSFDGMVAYQISNLSVATDSKSLPKIHYGAVVSGNFFQTLGVQPILGRGFLPEESNVPGRDAVAVVSYDFWVNHLAHDPAAIGRMLRVQGIDFTVVGVAPESFTGTEQYMKPAIYVPVMMLQRINQGTKDPLEARGDHSFTVKARLKPGVSRDTARADVATVWSALEQQYPDANQGRSIVVENELQFRVRRQPPDSMLIAMLMALVGLVLLIACANVASLMLGRAHARTREIALRISLGASRFRLLRQLLTESTMLSLFGGIMGLWLADAGVAFLRTIPIPSDPPLSLDIRLDGRLLIFSLLVSLLSAVLFGLAPAWRSLKVDLVPSLRASSAGSGGGTRTIGRNVLVVAQVALSMILLVAAGMLLSGFHKLLGADPGFRTDHRLMIELDPALVRYTPEQSRIFYRKLVDQSRAASGVRSVALAGSIPFLPSQSVYSVIPEGYQMPKGQLTDSAFGNVVDEHYFDTMNVAVIHGRPFTADDKEGAPLVAIVNEEFAKSYWPMQEPIGKRFRLNDAKSPWIQVVGLTKTTKYLFVSETPQKFVYLPFAQNFSSEMLLVVQTTGDAASMIAPIREVVQTLDSNQPVFNTRTLDVFYRQRAVEIPLLIFELVGGMGLLGLILALVGLYGLISYSVSRRSEEIGIRMAIGADKPAVLKMILRQGLTLALFGIGIGGLGTIFVSRLLAANMVGLAAISPLTYVLVPLLLLFVTLAASYIPARRASLVDPMIALHYE